MAVSVAVFAEAHNKPAAADVVNDQQKHQCQFGMQPALAEVIVRCGGNHRAAKNHGGNGRWRHDAAVQLAPHDPESVLADLVLAHGVVHTETRQVKNPCEPADDGNDVEGFEPGGGETPVVVAG